MPSYLEFRAAAEAGGSGGRAWRDLLNKVCDSVDKILEKLGDLRKRVEWQEEEKSKAVSRAKMLEGKLRKVEEDLLKEQKRVGKLEVQKTEIQQKLATSNAKTTQESVSKTRSATSANAGVSQLEKEVYKRDQELARLREVVKTNSFGFSQKFGVSGDFKKFFPMSGVQSDDERCESLVDLLQAQRFFQREVAEQNQSLKEALINLYEVACARKHVRIDPQAIRAVSGGVVTKADFDRICAVVLGKLPLD